MDVDRTQFPKLQNTIFDRGWYVSAHWEIVIFGHALDVGESVQAQRVVAQCQRGLLTTLSCCQDRYHWGYESGCWKLVAAEKRVPVHVEGLRARGAHRRIDRPGKITLGAVKNYNRLYGPSGMVIPAISNCAAGLDRRDTTFCACIEDTVAYG